MYEMTMSVSATRIRSDAAFMQGPTRNVRGRTGTHAADPISLAETPRRGDARRIPGGSRTGGVRTSGPRRCAYR